MEADPQCTAVHGEMTWNPSLHRWEGNESALREFDKALSSSTRPALITQLSSPNASRIGFPSLIVPTSPSPPSPAAVVPTALTAPNVKVVGSMVFDPVRMSWHSLAGVEGEDELDLMSDGPGGDWADDEGGERAPSSLGGSGAGDGWEMGEQARMLKSRASFVLSECEDGESGDEGDGDARRRLRRECEEGERRSREEMSGWMRREGVDEARKMREMLYEIRTVSRFLLLAPPTSAELTRLSLYSSSWTCTPRHAGRAGRFSSTRRQNLHNTTNERLLTTFGVSPRHTIYHEPSPPRRLAYISSVPLCSLLVDVAVTKGSLTRSLALSLSLLSGLDEQITRDFYSTNTSAPYPLDLLELLLLPACLPSALALVYESPLSAREEKDAEVSSVRLRARESVSAYDTLQRRSRVSQVQAIVRA